MSIYTIITLLLCAIYFGVISAKHDIHMFQLSSYRYSRYMRWLGQGNIWNSNRTLATAVIAISLIPNQIIATILVAAAIAFVLLANRFGKKKTQKTPLVYTNRVNRLYTTTLLLYVAIVAIMALLAPAYSIITAALLILLSDAVMIAANFINTPIEKGINRCKENNREQQEPYHNRCYRQFWKDEYQELPCKHTCREIQRACYPW